MSRPVQVPYQLQLTMLLGYALLAAVDLSFLYEVVGEVLDVPFAPALVVACGVGLAGLGVMIHLGYREADRAVHDLSRASVVVHVTVWLMLGLAVAAARLFRAVILNLQPSDGETLIHVFGMRVAQADLVFAPILFILFLITGIGARDATHKLLLNSDFHAARGKRHLEAQERKQKRAEAQAAQKAKAEEAKKALEARKLEAIQHREAVRKAKVANARKQTELEHARKEAAEKRAAEEQAVRAAAARKLEEKKLKHAAIADQKERELREAQDRRRRYDEAVERYRALEAEFHASYQVASERLAEVEKNATEANVLTTAGSNLEAMIAASESSLQQQVALLIHAKTGATVAELKAVIARHNGRHAR